MSFYEGLTIGIFIGILVPFGLPSLVRWIIKVKNGEKVDM